MNYYINGNKVCSAFTNGNNKKCWQSDNWSSYIKVFPTEMATQKIGIQRLPILIDADDEEKPYTVISKLLAEYIGTVLFVFIGIMSLVGITSTEQIAFAHGFAIALLIAAFGPISGGHFNPVVTLAVFLAGRFKAILVIPYIVVQILGSFTGALLVYILTDQTQYNSILGGINVLPEMTASDSLVVYLLKAIGGEAILTFLLTIVVLLVAVDRKYSYAPFAIGLTVIMDIFAYKNFTGASMNPARSFGPSVAAQIFLTEKSVDIWATHYVYWAGPILGCILSALLYRVFFAKGYNRILL